LPTFPRKYQYLNISTEATHKKKHLRYQFFVALLDRLLIILSNSTAPLFTPTSRITMSAPAAASTPSTELPKDAKCKVYVPPVWPQLEGPSIFLAGSIEMGKAIDWQSALALELADLPITILNPRRGDWDGSWKQDISNKQFKEQVDWEMDHLNKADVIALYFQPETMSPISLLELGMYASATGIAGKKLVVCCPEGFWRRGNVQIVCHRYGVDLVETREELIEKVKAKLQIALKEQDRGSA